MLNNYDDVTISESPSILCVTNVMPFGAQAIFNAEFYAAK